MKYKHPTGGAWDGGGFEIQTMIGSSYVGKDDVCPHAIDVKPMNHWEGDPNFSCTFPRVIIAYNEGGCASTGVCLDCVLDAVEKLKEVSKNAIVS